MNPTRNPAPKIGLALAGGVVEGAFYEIGVLCALEEAVQGLDLNRLDVYVGVSSGALLTACLANGVSARMMSRAILSRAEDASLNIRPDILFTPAVGEYANRLMGLPATLARAVGEYLKRPLDLSLIGSLLELGAAVPVGIFDNRPVEQYLRNAFSQTSRTNDFRELDAQLRIVAVDLDSSETVAFGGKATAHVPISKAVQASTALPVLYCPVEIEGNFYIDGVARRTLNASLALDEGAELLFCINPIVPVDVKADRLQQRLVTHGLPSVLSQTFRTLVHSRMRTGFRTYEHTYPNADLVLIEPELDDQRLFFSNIFSFSNRRQVCEHAYASTRRHLLARADALDPVLERYGMRLRRDVLADESRTLFGDRSDRHAGKPELAGEVRGVLGRLEEALERLSA